MPFVQVVDNAADIKKCLIVTLAVDWRAISKQFRENRIYLAWGLLQKNFENHPVSVKMFIRDTNEDYSGISYIGREICIAIPWNDTTTDYKAILLQVWKEFQACDVRLLPVQCPELEQIMGPTSLPTPINITRTCLHDAAHPLHALEITSTDLEKYAISFDSQTLLKQLNDSETYNRKLSGIVADYTHRLVEELLRYPAELEKVESQVETDREMTVTRVGKNLKNEVSAEILKKYFNFPGFNDHVSVMDFLSIKDNVRAVMIFRRIRYIEAHCKMITLSKNIIYQQELQGIDTHELLERMISLEDSFKKLMNETDKAKEDEETHEHASEASDPDVLKLELIEDNSRYQDKSKQKDEMVEVEQEVMMERIEPLVKASVAKEPDIQDQTAELIRIVCDGIGHFENQSSGKKDFCLTIFAHNPYAKLTFYFTILDNPDIDDYYKLSTIFALLESKDNKKLHRSIVAAKYQIDVVEDTLFTETIKEITAQVRSLMDMHEQNNDLRI